MSAQALTPASQLDLGQSPSLADAALAALRTAAASPVTSARYPEERNVWRPDSWLLQRCWQALADAGAVDAAWTVAKLAAERSPLAPVQVLHRVARQDGLDPAAHAEVARRLLDLQPTLLMTPGEAEPGRMEAMLTAADAAIRLGEEALALSLLEGVDQRRRAWDDIMATPDLRGLLASLIGRLPLHPLTAQLIRSAIRRHGEAGAQLLLDVGEAMRQADAVGMLRDGRRIVERCVDVMRFAPLTTLHSHRVTVSVLAQAGHAQDVLKHLQTIANVQEARRESGLALRKNDQALLRQVKRPQANADVDFLVYTLQEAVRAMPVHAIGREDRIALAQRLATLGMQSDGWTAAGSAATLVELGALKFAVEVVDNIAPTDPTRGEGAIALVRGLLTVGEKALADEQAQKALDWARHFDGQNPLRATTRGLAEVYLSHGYADDALRLLEPGQESAGLLARLRGLFRAGYGDDELRNDRLRFQALLRQNRDARETQALYNQMTAWAPKLLEGEALTSFYIDGLLQPLLRTRRFDWMQALLPAVQQALAASSGDRHAANVERVARLFAVAVGDPEGTTDLPALLDGFLRDLWIADQSRGIWQVVHAVEGSMALLLALAGPETLVAIAQATEAEGDQWLAQQ